MLINLLVLKGLWDVSFFMRRGGEGRSEDFMGRPHLFPNLERGGHVFFSVFQSFARALYSIHITT